MRCAMDLKQLRYFVAIAERGGFGAAANTLNIAQSALSRQIKELEHELGGALFERGARGVSATESGKVLLARGRRHQGRGQDRKPRAEWNRARWRTVEPGRYLLCTCGPALQTALSQSST